MPPRSRCSPWRRSPAAAGAGVDQQGGSQLPPAGGGGTLTYALPGLPATLDPLAAKGRLAEAVTRQVYEPLIAELTGPYGQNAAQPGLALSAHPSPNRSTWTLTLRLGVRFQDGTPFNAASVLANSRRWQSDARGRALLPHLFAVDAPRPDEVRFLLDRPVRDLPKRLASPRLGIVSPRALEPQSGQRARFLTDARGSGTGAFEPGAGGPARLELARFAGWWGSHLGLGPAFDGVTFVAAPRPAQRYRMLAEGRCRSPTRSMPRACGPPRPIRCSPPSSGPATGIGTEGSVRGITSAGIVPVLTGVWLTRLTG